MYCVGVSLTSIFGTQRDWYLLPRSLPQGERFWHHHNGWEFYREIFILRPKFSQNHSNTPKIQSICACANSQQCNVTHNFRIKIPQVKINAVDFFNILSCYGVEIFTGDIESLTKLISDIMNLATCRHVYLTFARVSAGLSFGFLQYMQF